MVILKVKSDNNNNNNNYLTIKNCDKTFHKSILKICRRRFDVWLTILSSQKVKDKICLNAKINNTLDDGMFLNKELCANGISLCVEDTGLHCLMKRNS